MTASVSHLLPDDHTPVIRPLTRKILVHAGAVLSFVIACLALWALYHTLRKIDLGDVLRSFRELPGWAIVLAFLATAASYLVVIAYDMVGLRHIGRPLPWGRVALASFLATAIGNNIGFSAVTGASVRYRIYSKTDLSAYQIAAVSTLCTVTTILGLLLVLAISLLLNTSTAAQDVIHIPTEFRHGVAWLILLVLVVYLLVAAFYPLTLRTRNWTLRLPDAITGTLMAVLGISEILLVGGIVYLLLPATGGASFIAFIGVFVLAMMAGGLSHVPGGIGVFETVLLLGLPEIASADLLASALLFRCIYFLTPLCLAAILFTTQEILWQRGRIAVIQGVAANLLTELGPQIVAIMVVSAGVVLLFSGAIPLRTWQYSMLHEYMPLWAVEIAHLTASCAGLGLVVLARGLTQQLAWAYRWTAIVLGIGVIASYLKDLSYSDTLMLFMVLLMLLPARREFVRYTPFPRQGFITIEWLSVMLVILATTLWLGLFNFKQVDCGLSCWWRFGYSDDFARFLRSFLAVLVLTGGLLILRFRFQEATSTTPSEPDLQRVRRILQAESETRGQLALLGDKRLLFSEPGNAFIMYQIAGKSWVALGDPVGALHERSALLAQFYDLCERNGGCPVFYLVDASSLSQYIDFGLTVIKLGDEARVQLDTFTLEELAVTRVGAVHHRLRHDGWCCEMLMSSRIGAFMPSLQAISDDWLQHTHARERGFASGFFMPAYIRKMPCAIVRRGNTIVAFAVLWASRDKTELALDLLRYSPEAPAGVMDFLLVELMLGGKTRGYRWFNLGIAPLARVELHPLAPLWHRIGTVIYRQGEHFQNIETLRRWEENFHPHWRPKYLASPGGINLPRILRDIGRLVAREV